MQGEMTMYQFIADEINMSIPFGVISDCDSKVFLTRHSLQRYVL